MLTIIPKRARRPIPVLLEKKKEMGMIPRNEMTTGIWMIDEIIRTIRLPKNESTSSGMNSKTVMPIDSHTPIGSS